MRDRLLSLVVLAVLGLAAPAPAFEFTETAMMTSCEASSADIADPVAALPLAAKPGPQPDATCTVVCAGGSVVSCTGSSCTAVNSACPSERGYVQCNGVTTSCPACPACGFNPSCKTTEQCAQSCGGLGLGVCINKCCYCY